MFAWRGRSDEADRRRHARRRGDAGPRVPMLIRGEALGEIYLTEKETGDFDTGAPYRDVRTPRDELERADSTLETTTAIARAVGGETDLRAFSSSSPSAGVRSSRRGCHRACGGP